MNDVREFHNTWQTQYCETDAKECLKQMTIAGYGEHAAKVIIQALGETQLTKFDFYQALHNRLEYLQHIVHDKKKDQLRFIFRKPMDFTVTVELTKTVEEIDLPETWEFKPEDIVEQRVSKYNAADAKFVDAPPVWQGLLS